MFVLMLECISSIVKMRISWCLKLLCFWCCDDSFACMRKYGFTFCFLCISYLVVLRISFVFCFSFSFRDGVSESQFNQVLDIELDQIRRVLWQLWPFLFFYMNFRIYYFLVQIYMLLVDSNIKMISSMALVGQQHIVTWIVIML